MTLEEQVKKMSEEVLKEMQWSREWIRNQNKIVQSILYFLLQWEEGIPFIANHPNPEISRYGKGWDLLNKYNGLLEDLEEQNRLANLKRTL